MSGMHDYAEDVAHVIRQTSLYPRITVDGGRIVCHRARGGPDVLDLADNAPQQMFYGERARVFLEERSPDG